MNLQIFFDEVLSRGSEFEIRKAINTLETTLNAKSKEISGAAKNTLATYFDEIDGKKSDDNRQDVVSWMKEVKDDLADFEAFQDFKTESTRDDLAEFISSLKLGRENQQDDNGVSLKCDQIIQLLKNRQFAKGWIVIKLITII